MANGCNKARENLDRFLDNDLSGREATDVAAHLDTCAACRQEFEQRRATQTALRRFAATPDGAQEARERVFARFERLVQEEARTLPAWRERVSLRAWREWFVSRAGQSALATATAAAVLAGMFFVLNRPETPRSVETIAELPDTAEITLLFQLHDAHVGGLTGDDPILRRTQTAAAQAAFISRADETVSGNL